MILLTARVDHIIIGGMQFVWKTQAVTQRSDMYTVCVSCLGSSNATNIWNPQLLDVEIFRTSTNYTVFDTICNDASFLFPAISPFAV